MTADDDRYPRYHLCGHQFHGLPCAWTRRAQTFGWQVETCECETSWEAA